MHSYSANFFTLKQYKLQIKYMSTNESSLSRLENNFDVTQYNNRVK